jgi:hypothetical protein
MKSRQLKALLKKNYIYAKRHYCSTICELIFPIVFAAIVFLIISQNPQYERTNKDSDQQKSNYVIEQSKAYVEKVPTEQDLWNGIQIQKL